MIGQQRTRANIDQMMEACVRAFDKGCDLADTLMDFIGTFYTVEGFDTAAFAAAMGYSEDEAALVQVKVIAMFGMKQCITGAEQKTNNDDVMADLKRTVAPLITGP